MFCEDVLIPSYQDQMAVGESGVEVVVSQKPKTTNEIKEQSIAARAVNREAERDVQKTVIALEASNIRQQFRCIVVFGVLFLLLSTVMASIAFATPEWRLYKVGESFNINLNPDLFTCTTDPTVTTCQFKSSRKRGLFVTCYADSKLLKGIYSSVLSLPFENKECVWEQKYNIQGTPITINNNCKNDPNSDYLADMNTNLMRSQWACFALALLMLFASLILSLSSFVCFRVYGLILAGLMTIIAAILLMVSMGLFHGYIHIEENLLQCPPFYATTLQEKFTDLRNNTYTRYGYSFWLGWVSAATSLVAGSFLFGAAMKRRASKKVINAAMDRLRDLNKDEKLDKKYEEMQKKIRRKEEVEELRFQKQQIRQMQKFVQPNVILDPRTLPQTNVPDVGLINKLKLEKLALEDRYEDFKEKCENRLQKLENEMLADLEYDKKKLEIEKMRVIEDAKKRDRRSFDDGRGERWLGYLHPIDDFSNEEKYNIKSNGYLRRANSLQRNNGCIQANRCDDPYTLHLPTGKNY